VQAKHFNEIAILVVSCDNYSDLWKPFFELFRKFWPDCPYKIYLVSNHKEWNGDSVEAIKVGNDISWSDNLINALERINEKYVFMFLEDLFLDKPVENNKVAALFDWAVENQVNYVKAALRTHKADKPYNEIVGEITKGSIYRASTVMALWKKAVLMDILKPGESAWQFELRGTERSDKYDNFFAVRQSIFSTVNMIIKGKWERKALKRVGKCGVQIDLNSRSVMGRAENFKLNALELRSRLLGFFPAKYRRKIRSIILGN
jgi:hypothetical protein